MSSRQRKAGNNYAAGPLIAPGSRDLETSYERAAWILILGHAIAFASIVSLLPGLFDLC